MLELLAIAPADGWAYVRSNGQVKLLRPPFTQSNCAVVDERVVEKAVQQHGFDASDRTFSDWAELIAFLNAQVRDSRASSGKTIPDEGLGAQMLEFASSDVLSGFLGRIETELLPGGDWESAERLLCDMLNVGTLQNDHALLVRATSLLGKTRVARRDAASARLALAQDSANVADRFPMLIVAYGTDIVGYNQRVSEKKQIFAID